MSIPFYTWLHLAGLSLALLALGGMALQREGERRKLLSIGHGVGLLLALVGGFGLLARYGIHWPWPAWVFIKVLIWVAFGGAVMLFKRLPQLAVGLYWGVWVLFLAAAWLGLYKPF